MRNYLLTFAACLMAGLFLATTATIRAADEDNKLSEKDQKFVKEAAIGGMMEVHLGDYAHKNGHSDAVKDFGKMMVTDHTKANDELKALAKRKGWTLPAAMDDEHKEMAEKLMAMKGEDFDAAYAKMMVHDHEEDVALFEKAAENCDDADLKAWAAKTLPTLKEHLEAAKKLHKGDDMK